MSIPMSEPGPVAPPLAIDYAQAPLAELLAGNTLAVIGFGSHAPQADDPRVLRLGLPLLSETASQAPVVEVWRAGAPVRSGREGDLRWSSDGEHLFVALELDEALHGGIEAAAEQAYRSLRRFIAASPMPHCLRLWNYLDAINEGDGDDERYRRFCAGRAIGMRDGGDAPYPAATAIGRQDGVRVLQVYGLAGRRPGTPVENPRQVSAWRYPRQYGPTAPTFARGMRDADGQLLISGTAAVVGHASRHHDDLAAQVEETWANLGSLLQESAVGDPRIGRRTRLKAYLRDPADAGFVAAAVAARAPDLGGLLLLGGDICRRELLVEIDGFQAPP